MPVQRLKAFLDDMKVRYVTISHSTAYTAAETAASAHLPGREFAKTVMVKLDDAMCMAVLRANDKLDVDLLRAAAGAGDARMASEAEFLGLFPGVDAGAMPPFGNLYGMPVYVDEALAGNASIAFNAGTHHELVRLDWADYERLVKPFVVRVARDERAAA